MFAAEEISHMSHAERLNAMERLWESFARDGIDYPSPAWHGDVLAQRAERATSPTATWLSLDELQARLLQR